MHVTPIAGGRASDRRYQFDVSHDGVLEASGTVAVTAATLTIADEGGRAPCLFRIPDSRYEWMVRDNELRLTLVDDHCGIATWRAVLTKRAWSKIN